MTRDSAGIDERRYQAVHAESVCGALLRTLERLSAAVTDADPSTGDVARLVVQDAEALAHRVYALRRRVEQMGAQP